MAIKHFQLPTIIAPNCSYPHVQMLAHFQPSFKMGISNHPSKGVIILPTQTMHCCKGNPSKWPYICILQYFALFDPTPKIGSMKHDPCLPITLPATLPFTRPDLQYLVPRHRLQSLQLHDLRPVNFRQSNSLSVPKRQARELGGLEWFWGDKKRAMGTNSKSPREYWVRFYHGKLSEVSWWQSKIRIAF